MIVLSHVGWKGTVKEIKKKMIQRWEDGRVPIEYICVVIRNLLLECEIITISWV